MQEIYVGTKSFHAYLLVAEPLIVRNTLNRPHASSSTKYSRSGGGFTKGVDPINANVFGMEAPTM